MAVPRTRKKLDKSAENLKKTVGKLVEENKKRTGNRKPIGDSSKAKVIKSAEKLDKAFEVVENLDKSIQQTSAVPVKKDSDIQERKDASIVPLSGKFGFRFKISVDAIMPLEAEKTSPKDQDKAKKSSVVEIGFTLPFIWGLPVIGGLAKKLLKKLNKE